MQLFKYTNLARKIFNRTIISSRTIYNFQPKVTPIHVIPFSIRNFAEGQVQHHMKDEPFLDTQLVTDRIIEVIKNFEKVNAAKVTGQSRFKEDLDLDSLDAVEVVMAIEEEFAIEIPDSEADKILSIPDAVAYISYHPAAR